MIYDLLFRNTGYGDVAVAEGKIVRVGRAEGSARETVDAAGLWLLPGAVDAHTHFDLTVGKNSTCDGWAKGSAAALAGGTTTVVEHISFDREGSCRRAYQQAFLAAEGQSCCDYALHGVLQRVDEEALSALASAVSDGVPSWKVYTTYDSAIYGEALERLFRAAKEAGVLVCVHCEDDDLLRQARQQLAHAGHIGPEYHAAARPDYCEARSVRQVLAAARQAGDAPVYIVHLSTAAALREVGEARRQGQANIFVETCSQYLLLNDSLYAQGGDRALRASMSPPLRTRDDQMALWQGLMRGDIDVLATDHCAFSLAQKEQGRHDLRLTPNGAPGVQERLTLLLSEGVLKGRLSLERAIELLSDSPARCLGLTHKGRVAEGYDADLVLFDPRQPSTFPTPPRQGGAAYSLYDGRPWQGRVEKVWLRGSLAYDRGRVLARPGQGQYVERYIGRSK